MRSVLHAAFKSAIREGIGDAKRRLRKDVSAVLKAAGQRPVFIAGWGKSSDVFIESLLRSIPTSRLAGCTYMSLKKGLARGKVRRFHATHPVVSSQNLKGSRKTVKMLSEAGNDSLTVIVSSGGGSAMFEVLDPRVSLDKAQKCIRHLLRRDTPIQTINYIRKACSLVKGGKLLPLIGSDRVLVYVISDIVLAGGPTVSFWHVASGPTMGERLSTERRREIRSGIRRSGALRFLPGEVLLDRRADNRRPRRGQRVTHKVLSDNRSVLDLFARNLRKKGFAVTRRKAAYQGENSRVAEKLIAEFRRETSRTRKRPLAYVCGGESTVEVKGRGQGGRLQDLAARLIGPLSKIKGSHAMAFASDGQDFLPGVGGVYINGLTYAKCKGDLAKRIAKSDTYRLHRRLGSIIRGSGPALNVSDLIVLVKE